MREPELDHLGFVPLGSFGWFRSKGLHPRGCRRWLRSESRAGEGLKAVGLEVLRSYQVPVMLGLIGGPSRHFQILVSSTTFTYIHIKAITGITKSPCPASCFQQQTPFPSVADVPILPSHPSDRLGLFSEAGRPCLLPLGLRLCAWLLGRLASQRRGASSRAGAGRKAQRSAARSRLGGAARSRIRQRK